MPNWCENVLDVRGDSDEIRRFGDALKQDEKGHYDIIASLLPMPEELRNSRSPTLILEVEEASKEEQRERAMTVWYKDIPEEERPARFEQYWVEHIADAITQAESDRRKKEYGADNWYEWEHANWGIKWGDCSTVLSEHDEEYLMFDFETAWGPPETALEKISALFPTLRFHLKFWEPGMAFEGEAKFKGGKTILINSWEYHEFDLHEEDEDWE